MKKLLLVRPEPGLAASLERALALGVECLGCPLFHVTPVGWDVPDPDRYDALLLTSANAVRHSGPGLDRLKSLPVHAVGTATAEAASAAGFAVASVGNGGVEQLLAGLPPSVRLLHLAGEDRRETGRDAADTITAYRSAPIAEPGLPDTQGWVIAVHSPRAGARLAQLVGQRDGTTIAAISDAAAMACGTGWQRIAIAERPSDDSLLALAAMLCHTSGPR